MSIQKINWGIIGCGDVTEMKSGPAFNKVPNSSLVAVMRRDAAKAKDYATRHQVPRWYKDAQELINDKEVNATYIATPPASHEEYTLAAVNAGKPVYVEKPMALNYAAAQNMANIAAEKNIKLSVAHYRREWPLFKKIKELLEDKIIGDVRHVRLEFYKPVLDAAEWAVEKNTWRVDPIISGGGLFHDLAPHQLDLMYYFFGDAQKIQGVATNQSGNYTAADMVAGTILLGANIVFSGAWCFNAPHAIDNCEITGSSGSIQFSFFSGNSIKLVVNNDNTYFNFDALQHVQQPMIDKVVQYFSGSGPNPCSGEEGATIMKWIEGFVK